MTPARRATLDRIAFRGQLRSYASWAKVGRELVLALRRAGADVEVEEIEGDRHAADMELPAGLVGGGASPAPAQGRVALTFEDPADYGRVLGASGAAIGLLVWEATRWPPAWVAAARRLDMVAVPSAFCAEGLLAAGLPAGRIALVPYGIDPAVYHPAPDPAGAGERRRRRRVVFVGTPARRKGLDVLLDALPLAFSPSDGVELVLKLPVYADAGARPYLIPDWRERCARLSALGFDLRVVDEPFDERRMAELYRGASVVCQPFRGEGYCMPLLEAAACGTPVVATDWSGPRDFLTPDTAWLVPPARMVPAAPLLPPAFGCPTDAAMAEPDPRAVAEALAQAVADPDEAARRGARAAEAVRGLTWDAAARALLDAWAGRDARMAG